MTKVVHLRKEPYDIRIDRRSIWGNPYIIGKDGTRKEVIEKYRLYIIKQPDLMAQLYKLKNKVLGCWCRPLLECHGDVLVELIENATNSLQNPK